MNRQELDERLVDYLYDELSDEEANRFEAAIAGHPDLEAEVAAHRSTREAAGALQHRTMSPAVMAAVMAEARAAVAPASPRKSWFESLFAALMQPAMMTAMLLFVVGGTSVFVVSQQTLSDQSAPMAPSPSVAAMAEEAVVEEAAEIALAAKAMPRQPAAELLSGAAPAAEGAPQVAAVDTEPPASERGLSAFGSGAGGGGKGDSGLASGGVDGLDGGTSASGFKPLSPTVSRLVELDGDAFKGAKPARARLAAKSKSKQSAKRAKARPLQVAKAPKAFSKQAIGGPRKKGAAPRPAARQMMRSLKAAPAAAPPVEQAEVAQASEAAERPRYDYTALPPRRGSAEDEVPAGAASSRSDGAPNPPAESAAESARKRDKPAEPVEVRGKRLVTEFERLLKLGNTKAAAKTLERLAAVPGFAKTAKRKRAELKKVETARSKTRKAPARAKGKTKAKKK